jgi:hypothetical protein
MAPTFLAGQLDRIAIREKCLITSLQNLPRPLLDAIPVSLNEVLSIRSSIDERNVIEQFIDELKTDERPLATKYEWYYDGREAADWANGYVFSICQNPEAYANTDQLKLGTKSGLESDVKLDKPIGDEVGGISIGLVLEGQHKIYEQVEDVYLHLLAKELIPSMTEKERFALPVLEEYYSHLFDLQLYRLMIEAASKVQSRANWVFVGTHERWPILVGVPV